VWWRHINGVIVCARGWYLAIQFRHNKVRR
jgi:hypothetical protein